MDTRKVLLMVGALILAGITALFARTMFVGSAAPQAGALVPAAAPVVDGPMVLVATRALPVGTILDATALKFQPWPKELVDNAYFIQGHADLKSLQGTVVRSGITAGQPVTQGALVRPGDRGFLAAALGPGMRAVTFPVSSQSAVAGFVFPGDRIDLVLTQSIAGGGDGPPLKVSETVMRNLRVLATDQRTDNVVGEDGKTRISSYGTVTVEATPKIAEGLAVAQTIGSLSVSLRSIADNPGELEQAIASGTVKVPDGTDPKAERAMMTQLARQPQGGSASVSTGADISRFQRSTVPARGPGGGGGGGGAGLSAAPAVLAPARAPAFPGGDAGEQAPVVRVARGSAVSPTVVAPAPAAPAPVITTTRNLTCSHAGCTSVATSTIGGN